MSVDPRVAAPRDVETQKERQEGQMSGNGHTKGGARQEGEDDKKDARDVSQPKYPLAHQQRGRGGEEESEKGTRELTETRRVDGGCSHPCLISERGRAKGRQGQSGCRVAF